MRRTSATRSSLEPVRDLCARLGDPAQNLPVVHVAGSKGKGFTSLSRAAACGPRGEAA